MAVVLRTFDFCALLISLDFAHSLSDSSHAEATSVVGGCTSADHVEEKGIRHFDFGTQLKNIIQSAENSGS